jgi:hypothetical protein
LSEVQTPTLLLVRKGERERYREPESVCQRGHEKKETQYSPDITIRVKTRANRTARNNKHYIKNQRIPNSQYKVEHHRHYQACRDEMRKRNGKQRETHSYIPLDPQTPDSTTLPKPLVSKPSQLKGNVVLIFPEVCPLG